ncbi:hypothetical protein ACQWTT_001334 [Acinetobacter baumannii]
MTDIKTVQHEEFWKDRPAFVMEVNPLKLDVVKKFFKTACIFLFIGIAVVFVSNEFVFPKMDQAQIELNNDTIKPEMLKLADSGKSQAAIWMAVNYPETDAYRLDQLILQKNSTAMLAKAGLIHNSDPELAKKYVEAAAAEGNPAAVKYLSKKNPNDIGAKRFFTEYVFK